MVSGTTLGIRDLMCAGWAAAGMCFVLLFAVLKSTLVMSGQLLAVAYSILKSPCEPQHFVVPVCGRGSRSPSICFLIV